MSHGVHAVQHEAEHKMEHDQHGSHGDDGTTSRNKKVALLIAVIALCLAFSETLGKSAQTAALSYNVEASNLWSFYQAKSIRQTALTVGADMLTIEQQKLAGNPDAVKKAVDDRINRWKSTAARYESEPKERERAHGVDLNPPYGEGKKELMGLALAAEAKRDTALERYHHYEVASAAFQIGIVLASATVITGMVLLSWLAGGLGLLGLVFTAIGFFAPHAVHLF
jgi:hypothetical protein